MKEQIHDNPKSQTSSLPKPRKPQTLEYKTSGTQTPNLQIKNPERLNRKKIASQRHWQSSKRLLRSTQPAAPVEPLFRSGAGLHLELFKDLLPSNRGFAVFRRVLVRSERVLIIGLKHLVAIGIRNPKLPQPGRYGQGSKVEVGWFGAQGRVQGSNSLPLGTRLALTSNYTIIP